MKRRIQRQPDPHWVDVRWDCTCAACLRPIRAGQKGFWFPASRAMYCSGPKCGQDAAASFHAAKQDEEFMLGQFAGGVL